MNYQWPEKSCPEITEQRYGTYTEKEKPISDPYFPRWKDPDLLHPAP